MMKIALINGSPKNMESASGCLLQELKKFLGDDKEIAEYSFRKPQLNEEEMEQVAESNALVFAFPLYVDGIPSHLLSCIMQLESFLSTIKEKILLFILL